MKRTPLKRTTPMNRGSSGLTRKRAKDLRTNELRLKKSPAFKSRKPAKTQADIDYMGRAARLGCMLCRHLEWGETPAEVHHPRTGTGAGKRAPHQQSFPLCFEHHRGQTGIHGMGRKAFEAHYGVTEVELRDETHRLLSMVPA